MAGRQFLCLEECAILLPHHWSTVQHLTVELPCCKNMTYHGYPMTIAQYFHAPQITGLGLGSHDHDNQRVYQQLQYLRRSYICVSTLTSLHLTLQCCQKRLVKVLKYTESLEELVLCIAHPSSSDDFLLSLTAEPPSKDWRTWSKLPQYESGSTAWHSNILPSLKSLSIQSIEGLTPQSLGSLLILRLVTWTRSQSSVPLKHLKLWECRGTTHDIVTDYISTGYLRRHFGISDEVYDSVIVRGMVAHCLVIHGRALSNLFHSTFLFKRLQVLDIRESHDESHNLPYLDQIKELTIGHNRIPAYSLDVDLPLVHTLRVLCLYFSTFTWMLGRVFKVLKDFTLQYQKDTNEDLVRFKGMQVNMPACEKLWCYCCPLDYFSFLSCPNLRTLDWILPDGAPVSDQTVLKLHEFLLNCPHLQNLSISISRSSAPDALIHFVFLDSWEQKVWQDIMSVEVIFRLDLGSEEGTHYLTQMIEHKHYEEWWNDFTVSKEGDLPIVNLWAST